MNEDSLPSWYDKLKVDASRTPGFTEEHMSAIERMAHGDKMSLKHSHSRSYRSLRGFRAAFTGVAAAVFAGALFLSYMGDDLIGQRGSAITSTPSASATSAPTAPPKPIRIERLTGLLGEQLPFKTEEVVGIRLEDDHHRMQPFEVSSDRLYVILQNLNALDMAAASIIPGPEHSWVPNAYTMTFETAGGSYEMGYDPSSNTYGFSNTLVLADDQVWMLMQSYINPNGEWAGFDRLSEQARNEQKIVEKDQITETTYERSRFNIDGLDYLGWEKKFLPLSSGTLFFDGVLGAKGLIQSLTLPGRENAYPDVIKLSGTIFFTNGGEAYTTSDGIKVGLTQAEVIAKLGPPNARTKTQWSYRIGDNLRFHLLFESGVVRFISLTMPV
ncbi:hypothetical protein SAMN05216312_11723 [Cohnella sp. OV330]|uniref:hypothetical protein n=1 Tax=Cohnella sp. OV330 TaxID=1855288 RepID=UPI0008E7D70E|nr:hypothetical protein [Cohnella sp. OV330]SFB60634.1 hypothetical protein SAMN05216312_11723 [Cohnella sp. OV330]